MKSLDIKALNLQYIQELEALRKEARAGKISAETYYLQVGGITRAGKAMDRHIAFIRFENQFKMDISKTTSRAKMLPSPEKESIKCPGCGKKSSAGNAWIGRGKIRKNLTNVQSAKNLQLPVN